MLHIGKARGDRVPDEVLRGMYAARKEVFIDLLKWDLPVLAGQYEVDRFDTEHAAYLVLTDGSGGHLASARLLPTQRPHILDTFYAPLCEDGVPCGDATYEITRFCLDRSLRSAQRREARDALVRALVDHALEEGIGTYSAVAGIAWARKILTFGWACTPLGFPRRMDDQHLVALRIDIAPDTPSRLDAAGVIAAPARPVQRQETVR